MGGRERRGEGGRGEEIRLEERKGEEKRGQDETSGKGKGEERKGRKECIDKAKRIGCETGNLPAQYSDCRRPADLSCQPNFAVTL